MEPQELLGRARQHFSDFERTNSPHSLDEAMKYATKVIEEYEDTEHSDVAVRLIQRYRSQWISSARTSIQKFDSREILDEHGGVCKIFLDYGALNKTEEDDLKQISWELSKEKEDLDEILSQLRPHKDILEPHELEKFNRFCDKREIAAKSDFTKQKPKPKPKLPKIDSEREYFEKKLVDKLSERSKKSDSDK